MCGKSRQDMTRNDMIRDRERVGVAPLVEKMVEIRRRWVEHVQRRDEFCVRVYQTEGSQITRGRGRPRVAIRESIKKSRD